MSIIHSNLMFVSAASEALAKTKFTPWSNGPLPKTNDLYLAIDPGTSGWLSIQNYRGVYQAIPIAVDTIVTSTDRRKKSDGVKDKRERKQSSFNYRIAHQYLREFKRFAMKKQKRPVVVVETSTVRPGQHIVRTVTQHIGIQMWRILAACIDIECFDVDSGAWKKKNGLSNDKSLSCRRVAEVASGLDVKKLDGLAESILLGYYFQLGQY